MTSPLLVQRDFARSFETMTLADSLELAKSCLHVLRQEKSMLLLPLMAAASILVVMGVYITSFFLYPVFFLYLLLAIPILWVALAFLMVFFQAGVVAMATVRLEGGDPRVKDGLKIAAGRAWPLLQWTVIKIIVGRIINAIRGVGRPRRGPTFGGHIGPRVMGLQPTYYAAIGGGPSSNLTGGLSTPGGSWGIGDLIGGALEMAWGAVTFFVLPVILYEKASALKAVGKSFQIVREVWKETLILSFGFGFIFALLGLLGIMFIVAGIATAGFSFIPNPAGSSTLNGVTGDTIIANPLALVVGIAVAVVYWTILAATNFSLKGILRAALYRYSRRGQVELSGPDHFNPLNSMIKSLQGKAKAMEPSQAPQPAPSAADEIQKLAALREKGIISEEEFQEKKKKLLETI